MNNNFNLHAPPDPVQDPTPYQNPIVTIIIFIAAMAIFIGALYIIGSYLSSKILIKQKRLEEKSKEHRDI